MSEPWRLTLAAFIALCFHGAVLALVPLPPQRNRPTPLMVEKITVSLGDTGTRMVSDRNPPTEKDISPPVEDAPNPLPVEAEEKTTGQTQQKQETETEPIQETAGRQPTVTPQQVLKTPPAAPPAKVQQPEKIAPQPAIVETRTRKKNLSPVEEEDSAREAQKTKQKPSPEPEKTPAPEPTQEMAADRATPAAARITVEATPLYRVNPPPRYPRLARRRGLEGTVLLEVLVDRNGRVREVRVQTSSGHPILDRAALSGVRDWRFSPGTIDGHPVDMQVLVPVRFQLK